MICYNNIKKERKSNLKGVIRTTQHNTTQHNTTQHNTTQQKGITHYG